MKYVLCLVSSLLYLTPSKAQDETLVTYFDKDLKSLPDQERAYFYRTVKKQANGMYAVADYYMANQRIRLTSACKEKHRSNIFEGPVVWYYENGNMKKQAHYQNGKETGLARSFYEDGSPKSISMTGEKGLRYGQHWTLQGQPLLTLGTGFIRIEDEKDQPSQHHLIVKDSVIVTSYVVESSTQDTVYTAVDEVATYKGGMSVFYRNISNSIVYPDIAIDSGVEGTVFIEFSVDSMGNPGDARVVQGIGSGCDQAALLAFSKQKEWIPGKVNGQTVKQRMVLPISFRLSED
jgi:TonB family protein